MAVKRRFPSLHEMQHGTLECFRAAHLRMISQFLEHASGQCRRRIRLDRPVRYEKRPRACVEERLCKTRYSA